MITYNNAKKTIKELQHYIELIDNYEINTIDDLIIYMYAIHNSISQVIKQIKKSHYVNTFDTTLVTPKYITSVILGNKRNELHGIIKKQYKEKTRPRRRMHN